MKDNTIQLQAHVYLSLWLYNKLSQCTIQLCAGHTSDRKLKLLLCLLCQLKDQKQPSLGIFLTMTKHQTIMFARLKPQKKVECENRIKGKNQTNLKRYLSKYLADTYRKLLEKE